MVKRALLRIAVILAAGLAFGSCQLIGLALSSTFPAAATQATARRDLSSLVSAPEASSFSMSDVTAGGREYVILSSSLASEGVRLIIMDTDLEVLLTLTAADVAGLGGSLGTSPAKLEAMGRILIGSLFFPASAAGLGFPPMIMGVPQGPGFESPVGGNYNFIGFSASGNNFSYTQYYDTWLYTGTWTFPIRSGPAAATSFSVQSIFSDPDPGRQIALFVLHDSGDGLDHYLVVPLGDLNGGTVLKSPLLDFYQVFTKPASDPDLMGYSNDGLVRFVQGGPGAGAFVRSDLSGAERPTTLRYFTHPSVRQAFAPSGSTYFSFDLNTRIVTRLTAWWN